MLGWVELWLSWGFDNSNLVLSRVKTIQNTIYHYDICPLENSDAVALECQYEKSLLPPCYSYSTTILWEILHLKQMLRLGTCSG